MIKNKLYHIDVVIDQPYSGRNPNGSPEIDVEFWRHRGKDRTRYNGFENISAKNFRNLCIALKDYKSWSVETDNTGMTVTYFVE